MELMEIFRDALVYPFQNIKALVIYAILGIIMGIAVVGVAGSVAASFATENILALFGTGIIGIIIVLFLAFLISGYELDIVKYGINRDAGAPGIDVVRQFINGFKLFIVNFVYYLIPIIIGAILAVVFQHWLSSLITIILTIIFGLAALMGQCRLAKTEDLGYALSIGEAVGDIFKAGIIRIFLLIILTFIVAFIIGTIIALIQQWNAPVAGVLMGILSVYITFFVGRAVGLLYSDV